VIPAVFLVLCLVGANLSGCSSGADGQDVQPDQLTVSDTPPATPDGSSDVTDPAADAEDLVSADTGTEYSVDDISGTWTQLQTSMMVFEFAGSQPVEGAIFTYHLVVHTAVDGGWEANHEICAIFSEIPQLPAKTVIPLAYVASLPKYTRAVEYVADGDGVFSYSGADFIEFKGCILNSPDEELPTDPDDDRVIDQDQDGQPGLTLRLVGTLDGDLYIAQRDRTRPYGAALSGSRIEGLLDWESTQSILASDPPILKQLSLTAVTHPDLTLSRFDMVRIPADADCAWVNDNKDEILPLEMP